MHLPTEIKRSRSRNLQKHHTHTTCRCDEDTCMSLLKKYASAITSTLCNQTITAIQEDFNTVVTHDRQVYASTIQWIYRSLIETSGKCNVKTQFGKNPSELRYPFGFKDLSRNSISNCGIPYTLQNFRLLINIVMHWKVFCLSIIR